MRTLKTEVIELLHTSLQGFEREEGRNETRKCVFSRHRTTQKTQYLTPEAVRELDQSEHDVVFVISELNPDVVRSSSSSSSSSKANKELIEAAFYAPDSYCLVYMADTERFHSSKDKNIPERGFWVVNEDMVVGETVWEILDHPSLTEKYGGLHLAAATPSVTFAFYSTHEMPPESIDVTIIDVLERKDKNGRYYLAFRILTKIGSLQWVVEYRFSEIKAFHNELRSQREYLRCKLMGLICVVTMATK